MIITWRSLRTGFFYYVFEKETLEAHEIDALIVEHGGKDLLTTPRQREKDITTKRPTIVAPSTQGTVPDVTGINPGEPIPGTLNPGTVHELSWPAE